VIAGLLPAPQRKSAVNQVTNKDRPTADATGIYNMKKWVPAKRTEEVMKLENPAKPAEEGVLDKEKLSVEPGRVQLKHSSVVLFPKHETLRSVTWKEWTTAYDNYLNIGEVLCETFVPASLHQGPSIRDVTCPR